MDFEETISQIENDEANKIDKIGELADNSTPEEVQALKELYEEEQISSSHTEETDIDDEKTTELDRTTEEKAENETEEDKTLPEKKEENPPESKGPIKISEDYISKADERDRNILQTIKGEIFSPKGLQNYLNAQRKIGELGQKLGEQSKKIEQETKPVIPDKIPQQQFTTEVENLKEIEVLNRLRISFPDLPESPEEANEYVNGLPQKDFYNYMKKEEFVRDEVNRDFNKAIYYQHAHKEINEGILSNDIEKIKAELKEDGIEDPTKFGLDFTIGENVSNNVLLQELLTTDGKTIDRHLVSYVGNVPILNEGAVYNKFFAVKRGLIRDIIRKQSSINSRKEAFTELSNHEKIANNTASALKSSGATGNKYKGIDIDNLDNLDPKAVAELKREMENN